MDRVREETAALLAEKPELTDDLRTVCRLNAERAPWTFDEVPLDTGQFGELVARGIAEEVAEGYRLTDQSAVEAVLQGEEATGEPSSHLRPGRKAVTWLLPTRTRPDRVVLLVGTLLLIVGFRLVSLPAVFRDGAVVLSGNDPYLYRYWIEQLLAGEAGWGAMLGALPPEIATGEPLFVVVLWGVSRLAGGTPAAAGMVLAWYPVVASVIIGLLVYRITARVFDDPRVSLAAVAMFAITPVAAYRASLGFADHHAFDYVWQALVILAVVGVVDDSTDRFDRRRWAASLLLGLAIAGQTLAWDNSPILLGPLGLYGAVLGMAAVADQRSPGLAALPLIVATGIGAGLALLAHTTLGWHTQPVAYAPALVMAGLIGVSAVAEAAHRLGLAAPHTAVAEGLIGGLGLAALAVLRPAFVDRLASRLGFLLSQRGIAEMTGLFGEQLGTVVGPLFIFGFVLFLGLPYLIWVSWRATQWYRPAWLVVAVYAWSFLVLSAIQIRFAGQLAPTMAIMAGLGFVHLAAVVEVARQPATFHEGDPPSLRNWRPAWPGSRQVAVLVLLFLLVASVSLVQTPVKTSQLTYENADYETAAWIATDADARDLGYPESYVFSRWDHTRMYNYFVNGEARSYGFAQSNYRQFLYSTGDDDWYDRLDERVGYVVIEGDERYAGAPSSSTYARLSNPSRGRQHFRAVYQSPSGENLVYRLVPGARLAWNGSGEDAMHITTRVSVPGVEFTYERTVRPDNTGRYVVTVPYPGTYRIGDRQVTVTESAVSNGSTV